MSTNYLTPLSMVFFVFAICASFMFISSSSATYSYVGDNKFILFKIMMVISTIAMGYVATVLSVSLYALSSKFGAGVYAVATKFFDFSRNSVVTTVLLYMSSIWLALAIALLPYGHTVYITGTNNIDPSRTKQLVAVQQTVYAMPFYVLLVVMALNLFTVVVVACFLFCDSDKPSKALLDMSSVYTRSLMAVRPTFGWYFKHDGDKWEKLKTNIGSTALTK